MTLRAIFSSVFSIVMFAACDQPTPQQETIYIPTDTTTSFKINNYWITPKTSFEFNSLAKSSGDTLRLVTCSEYVYAPFGQLTDKRQLAHSILKDFSWKDTLLGIQGEWQIEAQILKPGSSSLLLFFDNDPEATKHSYVLEGVILDANVVFVNNVKIGISIEEFYKIFFDSFPVKLQHRYRNIIFESCVTGLKHIYSFTNGRLTSITFTNYD